MGDILHRILDRKRVEVAERADATPLAELARLWGEYAPTAEDYVRRAVDPDGAAVYVAPPAKGR